MAKKAKRYWDLVLTDWDGTLHDSMMLYYGSAIKIFKHFGLKPPSLETYREEISSDYMESFYWKNGVPRDAPMDVLNKINFRFFRKHWNEARLHNGTKDFLRTCQELQIPVVIVSAGATSVIMHKLVGSRINNFIDDIRADIRGNKTSILQEILGQRGIAPSRSLFIEDSCDGIESGKEIGIKTVGCTYGFHTPERIIATKPDLVIDDVRQMVNVIKNGRLL
ncbi:MAG: HAD hydrolase-like protein [bacterium]|nr:HAD hydrolase-like protein [bacterium]